MSGTIIHGDCVEVLSRLGANTIDAIVCDPPYGLEFMGKEFDKLGDGPGQQAFHLRWAREALRVLKPGGHLIAFGGTRTYHRLAAGLEDAGFEIRDCLVWAYGSGFPKSLDVSKAIDKAAGAEREVLGIDQEWIKRTGMSAGEGTATFTTSTFGSALGPNAGKITAPATDAARQWNGWGTALKPAVEPAVLARKPLAGTVAANVLEWGTGALNVDGCRVVHSEQCRMMAPSQANIANLSDKCRQAGRREAVLELKPEGRWPANLIHDGTADVVGLFPGTAEGSAARFFYCAKAAASERPDVRVCGCMAGVLPMRRDGPEAEQPCPTCGKLARRLAHPTVKPLALMEYLIKLVVPPGGLVLDPFAGSGTTLVAAQRLGLPFLGIEKDAEYVVIARSRLEPA